MFDVGPRSAHIAKLSYDAFVKDIKTLEPVNIQPKPEDPDDYLALKVNGSGQPSVTITPTGASNILGLAKGYGLGNMESIQKCYDAVGKLVGMDAKTLADKILDISTKKVIPVVKAMLTEHKLIGRQITFVGGGGGAEAIVPYTAMKMKLEHRIARNNEVISAIGVALGIIQDTVERTIMNPGESDLVQIRKEAFESVQRMGADANSIEVVVEVDRQTKRVSATARGTPELRTRLLGGKLPSDDALKATAAKTAGLPAEQVQMLNDQGWMCVFTGERERHILLGLFTVVDTPVVVVDREGIVRLQVPDARVDYVAASELDGVLQKVIDQYTTYGDAGMVIPDVFLVKPGQIADLTGLVEANQMLSVARVETQTLAPSDKVALVSSRKG